MICPVILSLCIYYGLQYNQERIINTPPIWIMLLSYRVLRKVKECHECLNSFPDSIELDNILYLPYRLFHKADFTEPHQRFLVFV